jgi:hypothetical protein
LQFNDEINAMKKEKKKTLKDDDGFKGDDVFKGEYY